jgi:thioredoxin 1
MGFFKRLLGLERIPGEPKSLSDVQFKVEVLDNELPCVIDFYSLMCAPCQVMSGLLNEIGPQFVGRADFFKIDVTKNTGVAKRYKIVSVPTVIVVRNGREVGRHVGLMPLRPLTTWIEARIQSRKSATR